MRNIFNFTKRDIMMFIMGMLVCSVVTIVIAESINSDEVLYDNSNSSSNTDNVQDALDEMYNIIEHNSTGFSLLARTPIGLSNELIGGLYRYQGTTVDNYICFGTTSKNTCISDTDKYMYRIIGINNNGQMKLIKKEALNTSDVYHTSLVSELAWQNTYLYNGLNGNLFLTNETYVPDNIWDSKIALSDWHYGIISNLNISALEMSNLEQSSNYYVNAKIGLIYLHDYYYGLPGGNNCVNSSTLCKTSWIFLGNNDATAPNGSEWSIFRSDSVNINYFSFNGTPSVCSPQGNRLSIRPVFYLQASETIASGSGTLSDPYILGESL